jgi:hypothetical protein
VIFSNKYSGWPLNASAMHPRTNQQSGQALLVGVGMLALCALAWFLMLKVGSWIHNKSALHRATDAAVYSAALMYARNLNIHAYLNRAQLAHQVAQLHLFALGSAERFRSRLARQSTVRNPPPALLGFRFGPQYAAAYLFSKRGGSTDTLHRNALHRAFSQHDQLIQTVLENIRQSRIDTAAETARVLNTTLVANLGKNGSDVRGNSLEELGVNYRVLQDETRGFVTSRLTSDDEWYQMFQAVRNRYRFLDDRKSIVRSFNGINIRCPWRQHQLRRRTSLQLSNNGVWQSEETQSFHAVRFNRYIGCYYREYPMGWAKLETSVDPVSTSSAFDENEPMQSFTHKPFWRWVGERAWTGWNLFGGSRNPLAARWANQAPVVWRSNSRARYARINPANSKTSAALAIQVVQRWRDFPRLSSSAAAEAHFVNPTDGTRSRPQAPSLFLPFWQARLVRVPTRGLDE